MGLQPVLKNLDAPKKIAGAGSMLLFKRHHLIGFYLEENRHQHLWIWDKAYFLTQ